MALHFNAESEKASSTASLQRSRMSSQLPASQAANGTKDSQKKRTNHEIPKNRRLRRPGGNPGPRIAQATSGALNRYGRASGGARSEVSRGGNGCVSTVGSRVLLNT